MGVAPAEVRPRYVYYSSDEEDVGEYEVGYPVYEVGYPEPSDEEEEDWDEDDWDEEDWDEEEVDSGYESFSEDEEEEREAEEHDQQFPPEEFRHGWRQRDPPAEEQVSRPLASVLQQPARTLSPTLFQRLFEEAFRPTIPPSFPALSGSTKRILGEEDAEEPCSKRPRLDQPEESIDDPSPSTSAGTSSTSRFTRYFHYPLDSLDSDSD